MTPKMQICFVCFGNGIRSPLAAHLFLRLARQVGRVEQYYADSAGISGIRQGEPYDDMMVDQASRRGVMYSGYSRQFRVSELERFDLILAMDRTNWASLMSMARSYDHERKIRLLREFDPQGGTFAAVLDPLGGTSADYERVYVMIDRSVKGLLQALESSTSIE